MGGYIVVSIHWQSPFAIQSLHCVKRTMNKTERHSNEDRYPECNEDPI